MGEDLGSMSFGVAVEVDGDIHLQPPHQLGDVVVALAADIDETVERPLQSLAHLAAVIRTERDPGDFETTAVVVLEQTGRQMGDGVLTEVGGNIGDVDPAVLAMARARRRGGNDGILCGGEGLRALPLRGQGPADPEKEERIAARLAGLHVGHYGGGGAVVVGPVAVVQPVVEQALAGGGQAGGKLDGPREARRRFLVPLELLQGCRPVVQGLRVIRP